MQHGTYYIETYGCQMNDHDSEKMASLLESLGMKPVASAEDADVVVINTCAIREKAEHKVFSAIGTLKSLKVRNPDLITVVAGCVAQQQKVKLLNRLPHLDVVLGTHAIARLPEVVRQLREQRARVAITDFSDDIPSLHLQPTGEPSRRVCSYVTIMQGCSNFCTYCVVPYTRGPEFSRPESEIIEEVRLLASQGVREITLLGQNVNAYGRHARAGCSFAELLGQLDAVNGVARIRFTTSHPRDFDDDVIAAMAGLPSVCEHIHLPLQSGSDRVLRDMHRGYTLGRYRDKVERLRKKVPGVALTTDIIVGFPGETDAEFRETMKALADIRYDQIFSFKYSPRPDTAAVKLPNQVPEDVKIARLKEIHALQDEITQAYHAAAVGTVEEILIEGFRSTGQPFGHTRTNKVVNLECTHEYRMGDLVAARIERGLKHSLIGRPLAADEPGAACSG